MAVDDLGVSPNCNGLLGATSAPDLASSDALAGSGTALFQRALKDAGLNEGGSPSAMSSSDLPSSKASPTADAIMQGVDARQAAGRSGNGTRVAQLAMPGMPLPLSVPPGAMLDAMPPSAERAINDVFSRAGRRLDHIGGELAQGDLSGATGHALLGRPFPPEVDDPTFMSTTAPPTGPNEKPDDVNEDGPPASSPTGRQRNPIEIEPGTNVPAVIDGRPYTGHAIDRMQGRGIPASVVDDAIKNGTAMPGKTPGTTRYRGANGTVVITGQGGKVVTVY